MLEFSRSLKPVYRFDARDVDPSTNSARTARRLSSSQWRVELRCRRHGICKVVCFYDPQEDQGLRTETRKEAKEPGTSQTATTGQDGVPTEFPASQRFQEHLQSSVRLHGPAHRSGIPNSCRCGLWLPAPGANAAVDGSRSKDQELLWSDGPGLRRGEQPAEFACRGLGPSPQRGEGAKVSIGHGPDDEAAAGEGRPGSGELWVRLRGHHRDY